MDIDGVIGISLRSSVDLAEASYKSGWLGAIVALSKMVKENPTLEGLALLDALREAPVEPSQVIQRMRAALK